MQRQSMAESVLVATIVMSPDGCIHAGPEVERLLGLTSISRSSLDVRFDSGMGCPLTESWMRGEPFDEHQVWLDHVTGDELRLHMFFQPVGEYRLIALIADRGNDSSWQAEAMLRSLNESLAAGVTERSMRDVLQLIVELARDLTGARYAALGVLREGGAGLSDFIYSGIPAELAKAIGHLPEGKGLLGAVIRERRTIRLADLRSDPRSAGVPPNHPPMTSFLGAPLLMEQKVYGNFYMTDKLGAPEFSEEDAARLERFCEQAARTILLAQGVTVSQHQLFRSLVENAPYGIIFQSRDVSSSYCNTLAKLLLGSSAQSPGMPGEYEFAHPGGTRMAREESPDVRADRGETIINKEVLVLRPGRAPLPALVSAAPLMSESDHIIGALVVIQDITDLKELEALRAASTAGLAHDMRTPVQTVLLHAEALLRRATGDAAWVPVKTIRSIHSSGELLRRLVSDLLDASRIDSGHLTLNREVIDVGATARSLVERLSEMFAGRPVSVDIGDPPRVSADGARLEQILSNLLENAHKYASPGTPVRIAVDSSEGGVLITVTDEGPGIPAGDLPRLFDRYFRGRQESGKRAGIGLGLSITRALVEAHGGRIAVESRLGIGTVFRVWLPALGDQNASESVAPLQ